MKGAEAQGSLTGLLDHMGFLMESGIETEGPWTASGRRDGETGDPNPSPRPGLPENRTHPTASPSCPH